MGLEGCTEADMDFWCWRGRAELTAAEAEAVEALEPGVVRLGGRRRKKKSSRGEAEVQTKERVGLGLKKKGGGNGVKRAGG